MNIANNSPCVPFNKKDLVMDIIELFLVMKKEWHDFPNSRVNSRCFLYFYDMLLSKLVLNRILPHFHDDMVLKLI